MAQDVQEIAIASSGAADNASVGRRVLQNTAANIGGRGLALVFSAGAAIILARYLGSERLGQYGAVYAYLALFACVATFGFEPILTRDIARERNSAASLVHTAMVLSTVLCMATIALAIVLAPTIGYTGYLRKLLILAALEYVLTPLRLPAVIFQVDMRQWYGATISIIRQGLWFVLTIILWICGAPLFYVVLGRVITALVESGLMWFYGRRFLEHKGAFLFQRARTIFSHSLPIAFTSFLGTIYLRIDQVMLHKLATDYTLGQYVAAVKISELFEMLPSALMFTMAPILAITLAQPERFRSYVDRTFRYFMVLSSALCVFMTVAARPIIQLFYGKQFMQAAPLLAVLVWSEIAIFFTTVVVNVLIAENRQHLLPYPTLLGAGINVALNLALIPRYAAMGAAWATVASYTTAWMICLLFFKQTRGVTWQGLRFALPMIAVALTAVGASIMLPILSVLRILIAMAIFFLGAWLTRSIQAPDVRWAVSVVYNSFGGLQEDASSGTAKTP